MADQLATPTDLAARLQEDVDRATAETLIEGATAVVQAAVGQRLVQVVDDTVVLDLGDYDSGSRLALPERPVTAVSAVLIGATPVTDFVAELSRGRLYRSAGWRSASTPYAGGPSTVTVTYTHGFPVGDQRLQLARVAVLSLAAAAYSNPSGVSREQIDDYAVAYEGAAAQMQAPPALVAMLRKRYGRPARSVRLVKA